MTKNKKDLRCIKNRTWERDRRERLNNTFERLAKLLPDYEPKVTFSKIEILQKTITYIEELRLKIKEVSHVSHADPSRNQEELDVCLRALKKHNDRLVDLILKSNIEIPLFTEPIILANKSIHSKTKEISECHRSSPIKIRKIELNEPEIIIGDGSDVPPKSSDVAIGRTATGTFKIASVTAPRPTHSIQTSSGGIIQKTSPARITSTNIIETVNNIDLSPFGKHDDKMQRELAGKDSKEDNKARAEETRHSNKKGLLQIVDNNKPNHCSDIDVSEDRKQQSITHNSKILSPCNFHSDAKVDGLGHIDTQSKHNTLLDGIHSPQIDLSPTLLSPTAAFLLSFPVVSSALAKPVESDNCVDQKVKQSNSPRRISESTGMDGDYSSVDNYMNHVMKMKPFSSIQTHEGNNLTTTVNAASTKVQSMENSSKCSTAASVKPSAASLFGSNAYPNINRPSYESYNSLWTESPATLQTPAHTYGLPYYLRNVQSTSSSSISAKYEFAPSSINKNTKQTITKADNVPLYQPNLGQIFWDRKTELTKSQNPFEKKCSGYNDNVYSNHSKQHVNWMTTDFKISSANQSENVSNFANAYHIPSQPDDIAGASSRMIDSINFQPEPVLPHLNGDLALSTISTSCIHSTGSPAKLSNIQDVAISNKFDTNSYQRVNNFSAESLFSNVVINSTATDLKRQKNSNEYFSSLHDTSLDVGFVPNTIPSTTSTSVLHSSFENLNCPGSNSINHTSNGLHYTPYSQHQNPKNCINRLSSDISNPQSVDNSYKNTHSYLSRSQLPFTVPVFRDSCRTDDPSSHNEIRKTNLNDPMSATQNKNKNIHHVSSAGTNTSANFDNTPLDRLMYGFNCQIQPESKDMYSNSLTKSKNQLPLYNHSSLASMNMNSESTNSISNTITNFNLSTICPEIDRDFLLK